MCPHEAGASFVLDRAPHDRARDRERVALGRNETEIVSLADPRDVSLDSLPEQDAKIGRGISDWEASLKVRTDWKTLDPTKFASTGGNFVFRSAKRGRRIIDHPSHFTGFFVVSCC